MYDLTQFSLSEMTDCGSALRKIGAEASTLEEAAQRMTQYLYEHLQVGSTGTRACALTRFYKTHPYQALPTDLQQFAQNILGDVSPAPELKCLTLLATVGEQPEWNSRARSSGHKAIPLASEQMMQQLPMIARLVTQFGLELNQAIQLSPEFMLELSQKSFNVFHVPVAAGSPYIPAQADFVLRYGIQSVLGFGGMLPSGNLFAFILFTKVAVEREVAELFKTVALNAKLALIALESRAVFA